MGLEFLARVRATTLWLGGLAALMIATYVAPRAGIALLAGAAWSLVNLHLIERLVVALTGADRSATRTKLNALGATGALLALLLAGWGLLATLPVTWLMTGFLTPFVVMLFKAIAGLMLSSGLWTRLTRGPWRAALVVLAIAGLAWAAVSALPQSGRARVVPAPALAAEGTGAAEHSDAGEHREEKQQGFPNVVTLLELAAPHAAWLPFVVHYEVLLFSIFVAALICLVAFIAGRNAQMIPGPLQNGAELVVEQLYDFVVGILGPRYGPRYVPFLGTLFIYILAMNLFGLIPFMHSPTASLNVTVALALTVFVYVQFTGFKELGPLGWFDHMLGNPRDLTGWLLAPLMLPIHLLGELAKPISLSCRLFGNIFGEDMLLVAFASLGVTALPLKFLPFGLPLHAPFYALALLGCVLQALVFTVLSTIYILLMLPHEDHGHEGEPQHAH
jgi:F-type H+-transporting ATPase subunit a